MNSIRSEVVFQHLEKQVLRLRLEYKTLQTPLSRLNIINSTINVARTVIFDCRISEAGLWIRQDEIRGPKKNHNRLCAASRSATCICTANGWPCPGRSVWEICVNSGLGEMPRNSRPICPLTTPALSCIIASRQIHGLLRGSLKRSGIELR
jgi:hypothetical protein